MKNINLFFLSFIFYCIIGWIVETIYVSFKQKKFANRGFLIGPCCPIYGISAMSMLLILKKYSYDILILFFMGILIASFIEYLTSLILEKLFKIRWWDYSNNLLNIDGRVCLLNSLLFGICCIILFYILNPAITKFINYIPINICSEITIILFFVFIIDAVISFITIHRVKKEIKYSTKKDYTEEISSKVKEKLNNESKLFRRITNAFPNFDIINKVIK